jgi:uncharacterized protein (TIGR03382 family)
MTRTSRAAAFLCSALVLASGCGPDGGDPETRPRSAAIVNGQPETGFPAVGYLEMGSGFCTASLIGRCTALTAKHCVTGSSSLDAFTVEVPGLGEQRAFVASVDPHPSADLALVKLARPIVGVEPVALASPASGPSMLEAVTLVGYGETSDGLGDYGLKRSTDTKIALLVANQITFITAGVWGGLCHGDSGGPSFVQRGSGQVQVGVHSWGLSCSLASFDVQVVPHRDWIVGHASDLGSALLDAKPPELEVVSPAENATVSPGFELTVRAVDDVAIERLEVQHLSQTLLQKVATNSCASLTKELEGTVSVPSTLTGEVTFTVRAKDAAGKVSAHELHVRVEKPGAAPDAGSGRFEPEAGMPADDPSAAPQRPAPTTIQDPPAGCSYPPASPDATFAAVLLAVGLGLLVRRRRR